MAIDIDGLLWLISRETRITVDHNDMNYLYIVVGGFVIYTALMKRELLTQKESFRIILLLSIIMFLVGLVDVTFYLVGRERYFVSGFLFCPLITLAQYRLSHRMFLKYVGREPKDTTFIWSGKNLGKDRLFNVLYFVTAFWLVILVAGGIERLVRLAGIHDIKPYSCP
ncbi:MAG: hypothetical protein L0220_06645 [Acidobacteria bacterium]|nr:hypothetical protein [Acidobacteriota bacterium]